mmetsp:Transcript_37654/g.59454  ORF Transcript_37654/g.59454 Transcript_37654/m.59454 type:complete len:358 (+) Transcript_37654:344-1417(+)
MGRRGVLEGVEGIASVGHRVIEVVNVKNIGCEGNNHSLWFSQHIKFRDSGHSICNILSCLEDGFCVLDVSLPSNMNHGGPSGSNNSTGSTSSKSGCSIQSSSPLGVSKVLESSQFLGAVEHHRGSLGSITILVGIHRHGGNSWEREIEGRDIKSSLFGKRENKSTQATVHVKPDGILDGQFGEASNVVNHTTRKVGSAGVDHDGVGRDGTPGSVHIHLVGDRVEWDMNEMDTKHIAGFVDGSMGSYTGDDLRVGNSSRGSIFFVCANSQDNRLSSSTGHGSNNSTAGSTKNTGGHFANVTLELLETGPKIKMERICDGIEGSSGVHHVNVLFSSMVDTTRNLSFLPFALLLVHEGVH